MIKKTVKRRVSYYILYMLADAGPMLRQPVIWPGRMTENAILQLRELRLRLLHSREECSLDIVSLEVSRIPDSGIFQTYTIPLAIR
jgi:hypothetical protein